MSNNTTIKVPAARALAVLKADLAAHMAAGHPEESWVAGAYLNQDLGNRREGREGSKFFNVRWADPATGRFENLAVTFLGERFTGWVGPHPDDKEGLAELQRLTPNAKYAIEPRKGKVQLTVAKSTNQVAVGPDGFTAISEIPEGDCSILYEAMWYISKALNNDIEMRTERGEALLRAAVEEKTKNPAITAAVMLAAFAEAHPRRPNDCIIDSNSSLLTKMRAKYTPAEQAEILRGVILNSSIKRTPLVRTTYSANAPGGRAGQLMSNPKTFFNVKLEATGKSANHNTKIYDKASETTNPATGKPAFEVLLTPADTKSVLYPGNMPLSERNIHTAFRSGMMMDGIIEVSGSTHSSGISWPASATVLNVLLPTGGGSDDTDDLYGGGDDYQPQYGGVVGAGVPAAAPAVPLAAAVVAPAAAAATEADVEALMNGLGM